jgi:hypothetical protein
MTIRFDCPKCGSLIAFADKYQGRRAHCINCGQGFIIPSVDKQKAQKTKVEAQKGESLPGFYHALFVDGWKIFSTRDVTGLVFVLVAVIFKFFVENRNFSMFITGRSLTFDIYVPIGYALSAAAWGCLFWYYMEIIYATAYDQNKLPESVVGGFYSLIWLIAKSLYTLFIILLVTGLPYIVIYLIFKKTGVDAPVVLHILFALGVFLLPMAILTAAVGKDLTMLRPDYLLVPIFKAFGPYLMLALLLGAAIFVQMNAPQYNKNQGSSLAVGYLMLNFAVQVILIFTMHGIGLFFRHFNSHFIW